MNIRQAVAQLEAALRGYAARDEAGAPLIPLYAQRPVYLIGPPGVGKTAIVAQVAARMNWALVSYTMTHHTRQSALGLPRIVEREICGEMRACTEYTLPEMLAGVYARMEESGLERGILFLDEINSVSETLMPAMLELLQRKRFGQFALPEGWVIVCAGNPERYNRAARAFDAVTLDRLRVIRVEPDLDAWLEYAGERGVSGAIRGYLRLRPEDLYARDGDAIVSPRSWTDLSDALLAMERLGEIPDRELFAQYLQCPEVAERFALHWAMCRGVSRDFQLEQILAGRCEEAERHFAAAPFDELLCAATLLGDCLNRRAEERAKSEELARRLRNFVEAALSSEGGPLEICRERLARMEAALEVRRRAGALEPREEAAERALFAAIREAMLAAAGSGDASRALREFAGREPGGTSRGELRAMFAAALDFAGAGFANVHARAILRADLEGCPASLAFLRRELPGEWEELSASTDPELRAARLREANLADRSTDRIS